MYALLTDGAPRAGYHVRRGPALRDASSKKPLLASFTSEWRPARERHADGSESDRLFNSFVLHQHLLGKYDVAWQAPSWTSLIVFDIDRPEVHYELGQPVDAELERAANSARDQVLAALWDAFSFDQNKQPVVLRSPGDGYHVYLPLCRGRSASERTWPAAWAREHIEHHLNQRGLELHPGRLELFPSGIRLRAPCGAGSALLSPARPDYSDDLGFELTHCAMRPRRDRRTGEVKATLVRSIGAMVTGFCDAVEAARRPLDEWLGYDERSWHTIWGPWGEHSPVPAREKTGDQSGPVALSQHKEEVPKVMGAVPLSVPSGSSTPLSSGWLLYGKAFRERVRDLSERGLCVSGERHDAALKLTWYWGKCRGLDEPTTLARVREWLTGFEHTSATRDRSKHAFVRDTMREVGHYYRRHVAPGLRPGRVSGIDVTLRPLPDVDRRVLAAADSEVRSAVVLIMRFLRGAADRAGRVPHPLNLSSKVLGAVVGERRLRVLEPDGTVRRRRMTVVAIEEMLRLGILALHTDYSTGRHGRLYTCWYRFGSGALPQPDSRGRLILAHRDIEEGRLYVVAAAGEVAVRLAAEPGQERLAAEPGAEGGEWWVRMYQRRAFTPAEFFEGDARTTIPGPFRHRWRDGEVIVEGSSSPPQPAPAGPAAPAGGATPAGSPRRVRPAARAGQTSASAPAVVAQLSELFAGAGDELEDPIARTWKRWLRRKLE